MEKHIRCLELFITKTCNFEKKFTLNRIIKLDISIATEVPPCNLGANTQDYVKTQIFMSVFLLQNVFRAT